MFLLEIKSSEARTAAAIQQTEARVGPATKELNHDLSQKILNLSHSFDMLAKSCTSFSCIFKVIASCKSDKEWDKWAMMVEH